MSYNDVFKDIQETPELILLLFLIVVHWEVQTNSFWEVCDAKD